jgi:hypothetical protein
MKSKLAKIVIDVVLTFMFLLMASIIINWIAGLIFGTDSRGNADFNGGVLFAITVALSLGFAYWFYKYVNIGKSNKVEQ